MSLYKGLLTKGISSSFGILGGSSGGWYVYDLGNPTAKLLIEGQGYKFKPKDLSTRDKVPTKKITVPSRDPGSKHLRKVNVCFKNFLKNVENDNIEFTYESLNYTGNLQNPTLPENSSSKIKACTMMRHSSTRDKDKWSFESETVIRNKEMGIAVWIEADNISNPPYPGMIYSVLLFKFEQNDWRIQWGFSSSTPNENAISKKEMKSPDGYIKENYSSSKNTSGPHTTPTFENHKYYSGIWKETESGKDELFENVFQFIKREKFDTPNEKIFGVYALFKMSGPEKIASKAETTNVTGKDLQPWYKPFSGKKGEWITFEEYCSEKLEKRNVKEETKKLLIDLCYTKDSTSGE